MSGCELCNTTGGELVWQDESCRVIRVEGVEATDFPGFCRVVWQSHVREMSDLNAVDRRHLMSCVFAVEVAVRRLYRPDKINIASLGNLTPHVHWHVIPRWNDDCNFPAPIWAEARRVSPPAGARPIVSRAALHDAIACALAEEQGGGFA